MRTTMTSAFRKPTSTTVRRKPTRKPGCKPSARPSANVANHQTGNPFVNPETPGPNPPAAPVAESTDPRPTNVRVVIVGGARYTEFDLAGLRMDAKGHTDKSGRVWPGLKTVAQTVKAEAGVKAAISGADWNKPRLIAFILNGGDVSKVPAKGLEGKSATTKDIKAALKAAGKTGYSWMNAAQLREYARTGNAPTRPAPNVGTMEWMRQLCRDAKAAGNAGAKGFSGLKRAELIEKCVALGFRDALEAAGIEVD